MAFRSAICGALLVVLVAALLPSSVRAQLSRTFVVSEYLTPEDCLLGTNITYLGLYPMDLCVGRGGGSYSKAYQSGDRLMVSNCPLVDGDCACGSGSSYPLVTACSGNYRAYIFNGTIDDVVAVLRASLVTPRSYQMAVNTYADTCAPRNQTVERWELYRTNDCIDANTRKRAVNEYYYPFYYYSCNETHNYYVYCNQSDCTECDPTLVDLTAHRTCDDVGSIYALNTLSCPTIEPLPAPVAPPVAAPVAAPVAPAPVAATPTSGGSAPSQSTAPSASSNIPSASASPVSTAPKSASVTAPKASNAGVVTPLAALAAILGLAIALLM